MPRMRTVSRERIALVIFAACIVLMLTGIGVYLVAGHSWNYAATNIDDATGEMDDYKVILFEGTAIPQSSQVDDKGNRKARTVSLAAAICSYREKGADVFVLDSADFAGYDHPQVFERDGYRIGVVSIDGEDTAKHIQSSFDKLGTRQVNATIAIASDADLMKKTEGVDIIIDRSSSGAVSGGPSAHDAYRVKMPEVGTVAAIVISPSEVVSARTVRSL